MAVRTKRASRRTAKRRAGSSGAKIRGISRIDQPTTRTFGWFVRFGYRHTSSGYRPKFTAFFGDASHGGKQKAFAAAEKWVKKLAKTGKPPKR